jgi:multiple sugar transport system permease protein/raffinose/stachyose/melibiose transport system permease protein
MTGRALTAGARHRRRVLARPVRAGVVYVILVILAAATLAPLYVMLITGLKDNTEFYRDFMWIVPPLHLENYAQAWGQISGYIFNSVVITGVSVVGVVALAALAAYAFARLSFPGKELLYYAVIALMMLPSVLTLVPSFILVRDFGLLDTRWALILPYISGGVVFATFVLRSFFAGISEELFEAARIDGASELRVFWHLGMPLIRPAVATVAILQILGTWNDYLWPLVTLYTDSNFTLTIGLVAFQGRHITQWGPLMAGYTLAAVPLVALFALSTRTFIGAMTQGGLKL